MGPLKLFISHSSRLDDPKISDNQVQNPNLMLLLEIIAAIKQEYGNTVEIQVDIDPQGLPVGQDWEKRLNEWLAECHVDIILFSKTLWKIPTGSKKKRRFLAGSMITTTTPRKMAQLGSRKMAETVHSLRCATAPLKMIKTTCVRRIVTQAFRETASIPLVSVLPKTYPTR